MEEVMNNIPVLNGEHAVLFGAAGTIGAAVAREFAAAGAEVFLSGRTKSNVEAVAKHITANGGRAHAAVVDTLDDAAVNQYISSIVNEAGKLDIIMDAAGPLAKEYGNGKMAVDLPIDEFMVPLETMVRSRFITARAAARHMIKQHAGVIILVTGSPARPHVPGATAIGAAFSTMENLVCRTSRLRSARSASGSSASEHWPMSTAGPFRTRWPFWPVN
jgi:3-oxoacyl-[acyl-carrier protein] reductase